MNPDEPPAPRLLDQTPRHIAAHREMDMEPVAPRMEFRHPQIGERLAPQPPAQPPEEPVNVAPHRPRVMLALPPIGERPEPVQPVRRAVAADLPPRPPCRLIHRPVRLRHPQTTPLPAGAGPSTERSASLPASGYRLRPHSPGIIASNRKRRTFPMRPAPKAMCVTPRRVSDWTTPATRSPQGALPPITGWSPLPSIGGAPVVR